MPEAGHRADHNQVVAVRGHATRRAGTKIEVVGKPDAVVHKLSMFQR
jgi:hypothetical protein